MLFRLQRQFDRIACLTAYNVQNDFCMRLTEERSGSEVEFKLEVKGCWFETPETLHCVLEQDKLSSA